MGQRMIFCHLQNAGPQVLWGVCFRMFEECFEEFVLVWSLHQDSQCGTKRKKKKDGHQNVWGTWLGRFLIIQGSRPSFVPELEEMSMVPLLSVCCRWNPVHPHRQRHSGACSWRCTRQSPLKLSHRSDLGRSSRCPTAWPDGGRSFWQSSNIWLSTKKLKQWWMAMMRVELSLIDIWIESMYVEPL